MGKILTKKFFERSAIIVAEELIGKFLVTKNHKYLITETEAYEGKDDLASHASRGKTKRNGVMFGEAGKFYVYLVYGMHYMLNVVTGEVGHPGAVLIRGIVPSEAAEIAFPASDGINGPGKITKILNIDTKFNEQRACREIGLWLEDNSQKIPKKLIKKAPRVGVTYAGPSWSNKLWRFVYRY